MQPVRQGLVVGVVAPCTTWGWLFNLTKEKMWL